MVRLALIFLTSAGLCIAEDAPIIVAHRGASHDAPENTLAAFRLAWEKGSDAIEGDFFLTKDGQIVCTHDAETKRFNKTNLVVANSTLAELQALDVGSWKNSKFAGERMPTLQQVMRTVPAGKRIFIEVKTGPEILPHLKREIGLGPLKPDQITIISFDKAVIESAKETLPEIKAYWLTAFNKHRITRKLSPTKESVIKTLEKLKCDGLDCQAHESVTKEFLDEVKAKGFETHCWTVNDPDRARELAAMGMQSVTTDRPALIRKAFEKVPAQ